MRLITEPAAAAVAYGLHGFGQDAKYVFVFDLGGGTYDISVLRVKNNKYKVLSTNGDTQLGGIDFDDKLHEYCMEDFNKKYKKDMSNDSRAVQRLRESCESAKKELAHCNEVF